MNLYNFARPKNILLYNISATKKVQQYKQYSHKTGQ